jgi:PAS domain S-box-containing protein
MAKILVVEDRPINREFLVNLLGYRQHQLREASDGAEAIEIVRREHPDLIISNVLMPTMDGYEFVRQLRADPSISHIPVIFSAAHYLRREASELAAACGGSTIIAKPCAPEEVLRIVDAALANAGLPDPIAPGKVEEFDREHLQLLTDKLAQKSDELRAANDKLNALIELGQQMNSEPDPLHLLNEYCRRSREIVGASWSAVGMFGADQQTLHYFYTAGMDVAIAKRIQMPEGKVFDLLSKEGHAYRYSTLANSTGGAGLPPDFPPVSSLLLLPIVFQERVHGWLCLADKLGADEFSDADERLTQALAAQVGTAYENATLLNATRRHAAELERESTERYRIIESLRVSEDQFRIMVDSIPQIAWMAHADGFIFWYNQRWYQYTGMTPEQMKGWDWQSVHDPAVLPKVMKRWKGAVAAGQPFEMEFPLRGADGRFRTFLTRIQPLKDSQGCVVQWFGTNTDVEELKQMEESLRKSEARYRRLFEYAPDGIVIANPEGYYIDANASMCRMLGYTRDKLIGLHSADIVSHTEIEQIEPALRALKTTSDYHREWQLRRKDGSIFTAEVIGTAMPDGNIMAMTRDITERKFAEDKLKESNQMLNETIAQLRGKTDELTQMTQQLWQTSKLAVMGELAASVAHELNNPLATVGLRAEALIEQFPADDPKRRALQVIEQEVERMASLVGNLLQFSRRSHQQVSTLDVGEEITGTHEFIHHHLASHSVTVEREYAANVPTVQADRQQFRQLFLNLLTNASDAMPEGGTLIVRVFSGQMESGGAAVVVEFADTGTGITPADLTKIWEPFFTTKPEGKGTGLGLAICRRIVKEHKGTISIESEPGRGTTVRIKLPATNNAIAADSQ